MGQLKPISETHYTVAEASALLAKPASVLKVWRSRKQGPPFGKIGRDIWYPKTEFEEWRAEQLQLQGDKR